MTVAFQDGRSAQLGANQAIVKWSSDNRSYVAAKVIAGFGTLIYMAVTSVPFHWDEGGFAKLNWPRAKAEVPNDKDVTANEFMVPPLDGWSREMSKKFGALHLGILEDQKSPEKPKRRPKGTTSPKSSLRKRYAHFDPTSVMDLPVPDQGLPIPELRPRINPTLQRNEAFNIDFKSKKQVEEDPGNLIKFNTPAPATQQEVAQAVEPAQLTISPLTSPITTSMPSLASGNDSSIL